MFSEYACGTDVTSVRPPITSFISTSKVVISMRDFNNHNKSAAPTIRCCLYARVSTNDGRQDTENQLPKLREYCQRQGYAVVHEYIDQASGKSSDRDAFRQLFDGASKRLFDRVVVWALDCFTREGVLETFEHIRRLTNYGVAFESYTEQHFRTTGPAGELMLAVAAWVSKQERLRISDRTKAGLERARRSGKHCGRPRKVWRRDEAIRLRAEGWSWRRISAELGEPVKTIRDGVATACGESPSTSDVIHDCNITS
jgi:DNA invertase Pin-like site-specific DNA recombinase